MASLDLVSGTGEEARTWITGLKYLMAGISDEDSLAKRQRTRDQYPFTGGLRLNLAGLLKCRSRLGSSRLLSLTVPRRHVAETDLRRGRQERRRQSEHRRGPPAPPQAQRQPAAAESQADVQGMRSTAGTR